MLMHFMFCSHVVGNFIITTASISVETWNKAETHLIQKQTWEPEYFEEIKRNCKQIKWEVSNEMIVSTNTKNLCVNNI